MAIVTSQVTLKDDAATLLATGAVGGTRVRLGSESGNQGGMYLGATSAVSASTGYFVSVPGIDTVGGAQFIDIASADTLWAIAAPGNTFLLFVMASPKLWGS